MNPSTQRTLYALLGLLITSSLACVGTSILNDTEVMGDPIINRPTATSIYDLTDEREAEFQPYLGTSQLESVTAEHIPGITNCPPADVDLSPDVEVKYEIEGNILTATDAMGSRDYQYNGPTSKQFYRELPDGSLETISFETIAGTKVVNLRRYLHDGDLDSLCYDQYSQFSTATEELLVSVADAILIEQCLATPNIYQAEFTNISDEYSNESKKVCQGDFVIENLSSDQLYIKYYHISDDGSNHHEEWYSIVLAPGEIQEDRMGSQKWTDGTSTLDTFTNLIAVRSSIADCATLIADENISKWSEYFVPLNDPCR